MTPAEVFTEAAAILDAAEGTCTWLAVLEAYEDEELVVGANSLLEILARVLGVEPTVYAITDWNDVRGRTKEEAVAALRSAAEVSR